MEPKFLTELQTQDIDDTNSFLLQDLVYQSPILEKMGFHEGKITVPKGFVSDKSSTPRVPLIYLLYGDRAHREGFLHDYLYRAQIVKKSVADKIFLEAMKSRGKGFFARWGMYLGVVFGGRSSYQTGPSRFEIKQGGDNE